MQKGNNDQKHSRPVMDIAKKLPKHNIVLDKLDGLISSRRGGIVMKTQQDARKNLKQKDNQGHAPQPKSVCEAEIGSRNLARMNSQKQISHPCIPLCFIIL